MLRFLTHSRTLFPKDTLNWLFFRFLCKLTKCGETCFPTSIYVKWFLTLSICEDFVLSSFCIFCLQKRCWQFFWHLLDQEADLFVFWLAEEFGRPTKVKSAASRNENVTQVYFLSYKYNFLIFFLTYSEVF